MTKHNKMTKTLTTIKINSENIKIKSNLKYEIFILNNNAAPCALFLKKKI